MYKLILLVLFTFLLETKGQAQIVNIPDANFKARLLLHGTSNLNSQYGSISTIDTNNDGEIQVTEAQAYSGLIDASSMWQGQIADLTGIEAFTNLTQLHCENNQLTSLDLSMNINLTKLHCYNNQLTSLDLSINTNLADVICSENQLTSLDVSTLVNLVSLGCSYNQLTSLDLSMNQSLGTITCDNNQLTSFDLSGNPNLYNVICADNQLTSLVFSPNPNPNMYFSLYCQNNYLGELDLSANINVLELQCYNNQLSRIDVSTNNNNLLYELRCYNNLSTLQICVVNILTSPSNGWVKDATATYVENCNRNYIINGTIRIDGNSNCQVDNLEVGVPYALLLFDNGVDQLYTATNNQGNYQIYLDTGDYTITPIPGNPYLSSCSSNPQQVAIDTNNQLQAIDFSVEETIICPYLEVDISTPLLRRCFNSTYYVNYCNRGTATANSAYIEVELDANLSFNSSSIPLISQIGNVYRFNVGNLPRDTCGRFRIDATVNCNSLLGEIHCTKAHIYPDSLCLTSLPNIHIADTCLIDTVLFVVTNYADGVTLPYLLLEDGVVVDTGSFMLNMGQSVSLYYPTSSSGTATYQLVLANGSPTHYTASGLVGCDVNSVGMDLLHLPNLPQDFADIDCTPNRGSYDPNDKTGYPLGYGSNHYINPNSTIDYRIRFQNTGTDTAIFINIFDTISSNLDIGTLNMGLASHPYTLHIMPSTPSGQQVLRFQFSPIHLPDSNVNEPASNGFIEYSIAQVANLPNGTIINNSASIYFDYNAPVQTNTTLHTVCDDCHPENITSSGTIVLDVDKTTGLDYKVRAIPNPFREQTRIVLEGYTGLSTDLKLEVYDVMGRLQKTLKGNNDGQFLLQRGAMPVGVYFFRISENGRLLESGRLSIGE